MTLEITQGPLPQDGERVDASIFLEEWVGNTDVGNLDPTSFAESIRFVAAMTEAPPDVRGTLWFKRGEGQLYFREYFDRSASPRYPGDFNKGWVPLAPRRGWAVEADGAAQKGGVMFASQDGPGGAQVLNSYFEDSKGRRIPSYRQDGQGHSNRYGVYTGIATESRDTGQAVICVDWGFCDALIACGGSNVTRGAYAKMHSSSVTEPWVLHPRSIAWSGETGYRDVGIIVNTNATIERHLTRIYKRPNPNWVY